MKHFLGLLICLLFFSYGYCQQQTTKANLIYLNGFSWNQGDKKLSSSKLQAEVFKTPAAQPYYRKGKLNSVLSKISFGAGILFTVAAIQNSDSYYYTNNHRRISYSILSGSSFILSAVTLKFAFKNKGKAIYLRNLDIVSQ